MKKVLFATTALVLTAGIAAAEVKVSGDGRMGVVYDGETANFNSRIRAIFTLSGETDGGLAFGGTFRADNANAATNGSGGTIFISGAFGTLTMGDTDGGAENAVGDLSGVGYSNANSIMAQYETEYLVAAASGDPLLNYAFTAGDFSFYAAMTDGTEGGYLGGTTSTTKVDFEGYSVGLAYTFGDYGIAAGYESLKYDVVGTDRADQWLISGTAGFGAAKFKAFYAQGSAYALGGTGGFQDFDQYGVSLDYTFGATTVTGFYRELSMDIEGDAKYYGIGAAYELGGGATLKGGVMKVDRADGASFANAYPGAPGVFDDTVADFGVVFKF